MREEHGGKAYFAATGANRGAARPPSPHVLLLPNYDELYIAFKDRSMYHAAGKAPDKVGPREEIFANHLVLVDGKIAGAWRRTLAKDEVRIEVRLTRDPGRTARHALDAEAERYGRFVGRHATLRFVERW